MRNRDLTTPRAPTEDQFLHSLISVAQAAGWTQLFHLVDRGRNSQQRELARELRGMGQTLADSAADLVDRSAHARVTSFGFPDLVGSHPEHGILIAELKSDRAGSKPTPEQWQWLLDFAACLLPPDNPHAPGRVHLWRPKDWPAINTQLGLADAPNRCECPVCTGLIPPLAKPRRPTSRKYQR